MNKKHIVFIAAAGLCAVAAACAGILLLRGDKTPVNGGDGTDIAVNSPSPAPIANSPLPSDAPDEPPAAEPPFVSSLAYAPKASVPVTVDGLINETAWGGFYPIDRNGLPGAPKSGGTAEFAALWTDIGLYIAVRVNDKDIPDDGGLSRDYAVTVSLSGSGEKRLSYGENDYQIVIYPNEPAAVIQGGESNADAEAFAAAVRTAASVSAGTGYTAEIEVPWEALNVPSVHEGVSLGLDVSVGGKSDGGDRTMLSWCDTHNVNALYTSAFGTLVLTGKNQPVISRSGTPVINGDLNDECWLLDLSMTTSKQAVVSFGSVNNSDSLFIGIDIQNRDAECSDEQVAIYIDGANDRNGAPGKYDNVIVVNIGPDGNDEFIMFPNYSLSVNYVRQTSADGKSLSIEFVIPWSVLGITPYDGMIIGFDVVYDFKVSGSQDFTAWNGTSNNWRNKANYGTLIVQNTWLGVDHPAKYDVPISIVTDTSSHSAYDAPEGDFFLYDNLGDDILAFSARVAETGAFRPRFEISGDGVSFTELTEGVHYLTVPYGTEYGADVYRYESIVLPEGAAFLKIVFTNAGIDDNAIVIRRVSYWYKGNPDNHAPETPPTLQFNTAYTQPLNAIVRGADADGDTLTYSLDLSMPPKGAVTVDPRTGDFSYAPRANYVGHDIFKIMVSDGHRGVSYTRIVVTVTDLPSNMTYYVDPVNGDDSVNDGKSGKTAFQTAQKAHDISCPGDTIYLMGGTYTTANGEALLKITRSGLPGKPITYKALDGHTPVFYAANSWYNIYLESVSHIVIDGLTVKGDSGNITQAQADAAYSDALVGVFNYKTSTNGIAGRPKVKVENNISVDAAVFPHHIEIRNCEVYNLPNGGITFEQTDWLTVENNYVHDNCRWDVFASSGINIYGSFDVDTDYDAYKIVFRNNISANNYHLVPWYLTKDFSDGNGIIIDDNKHDQVMANPYPYYGKTLVANNLVYGNGGSGIHAFSSENVDIINNTSYMNNATEKLNWGEIFVQDSDNCNVINNIAYSRTGSRMTIGGANNSGRMSVLYDYNIYYNYTGGELSNYIGTNNKLGADPLFTDPAALDFTLKENSPGRTGGVSAYWAGLVGNMSGIRGIFAHVGVR